MKFQFHVSDQLNSKVSGEKTSPCPYPKKAYIAPECTCTRGRAMSVKKKRRVSSRVNMCVSRCYAQVRFMYFVSNLSSPRILCNIVDRSAAIIASLVASFYAITEIERFSILS